MGLPTEELEQEEDEESAYYFRSSLGCLLCIAADCTCVGVMAIAMVFVI